MHTDDVSLRVFASAEREFVEFVSRHLLLGHRCATDSILGRKYWETISLLRIPKLCVRHFLSTTTAAMNAKLKKRSCIMYNIVLYYDDKGSEIHVVLSDARNCNFQYKKKYASEFSRQDAASFKFIFVPIGGHNNSFWHIIDYFYRGTINVMYINSERVKQCIQEVKNIGSLYVKDNTDIYLTGIKAPRNRMDNALVELVRLVNLDCTKRIAACVVCESNVYSIMLAEYVYTEAELKKTRDIGISIYCLDGLVPKLNRQHFLAGGFVDHLSPVDYSGFSIFEDNKQFEGNRNSEFYASCRRSGNYVHIRPCAHCCVTI